MYNEQFLQQFPKMLKNLNAILDKGAQFAEAKKIDFEVLANSRLAPDQFNLVRQIQISCDTVKLGISRITGKDAPVHDDNEKTLAQLKSRIDSVVTYLKSFQPNDFQGVAERKITTPRWDGKYLHGDEYFLQHVIPNFYFHVTTAYAILRHNGVDVGKKDFLGEMPYKK